MTNDDDEERGRLEVAKAKWANRLVSPQTLKVILATGVWITNILRLVIDLVKLFKT